MALAPAAPIDATNVIVTLAIAAVLLTASVLLFARRDADRLTKFADSQIRPC